MPGAAAYTGVPGWHGPPPWARLWLPVILSALVQVPFALWTIRMSEQPRWHDALALVLALVGPLALIAARRFPGPVVAIVSAAAVVELLVIDRGGPPPVALIFAVLSAVVRGARVWAWISLAVGWTVAITVGTLVGTASWPPLRVVGTTLGILIVLGIGEAIRTRRERAREFRAAMARRRLTAAEEERMRIARELHDVLAHSLSQINVQAAVGLHLAETQPATASDALASIKDTSKAALDEVRAVLGVLRADGDTAPRAPQPGLDAIAGLVASAAIPAATVELDDRIAGRAVPTAVGAAAYRIVQEALTNIARHGSGVSRVEVRLRAEPDRIRVEVHDDGRAAAFEPGRGLLGMRERAELLGGTFDATNDDGFLVRAELPTGGKA